MSFIYNTLSVVTVAAVTVPFLVGLAAGLGLL